MITLTFDVLKFILNLYLILFIKGEGLEDEKKF